MLAKHRPGMGVILFCLATRVYSVLESRRKRYFRRHQISKKICTIFVRVGTSGQPWQDYIWIGGGEPRNEGKPWNGKLIRKLLLTVTVVDPERFTPKSKSVTDTKALVECYN